MLNWNFSNYELNRQHQEEQMRKADRERLAQEAQDDDANAKRSNRFRRSH